MTMDKKRSMYFSTITYRTKAGKWKATDAHRPSRFSSFKEKKTEKDTRKVLPFSYPLTLVKERNYPTALSSHDRRRRSSPRPASERIVPRIPILTPLRLRERVPVFEISSIISFPFTRTRGGERRKKQHTSQTPSRAPSYS